MLPLIPKAFRLAGLIVPLMAEKPRHVSCVGDGKIMVQHSKFEQRTGLPVLISPNISLGVGFQYSKPALLMVGLGEKRPDSPLENVPSGVSLAADSEWFQQIIKA